MLFRSFALIGGGPQARESGHQVVLKVISRSNPDPVYRSDATYFERLHAEMAQQTVAIADAIEKRKSA